MQKEQKCCHKFSAQVLRARAEVARVARIAQRAEEKGRPMGKYLTQIEEAKKVLRYAEQGLTDHEADHAAELVA